MCSAFGAHKEPLEAEMGSHSRLLPLGWEGLGGTEVSGWMETALQAPPQAGTHRGSWPPPALPCCARGSAGCELLASEVADGVFCFFSFPSLLILMSGHGKPVGHRGALHPIVCLQRAHALSRSAQCCSRRLLQGQEGSRAQLRKNITPNSMGFGQFAFKKCMF